MKISTVFSLETTHLRSTYPAMYCLFHLFIKLGQHKLMNMSAKVHVVNKLDNSKNANSRPYSKGR